MGVPLPEAGYYVGDKATGVAEPAAMEFGATVSVVPVVASVVTVSVTAGDVEVAYVVSPL